MEGDQDAVVDCSVARTTSGRLWNLSSYREDSVSAGEEPPNGITSLKEELLGIWNRLRNTLDLLGLARTTRPQIEWFGVGALHQ